MQKQGPEGAQQRTAAAVTGQQRGRRVLHHPSLADSAAAEAVSLPPRSSGTSYSKGMGIIRGEGAMDQTTFITRGEVQQEECGHHHQGGEERRETRRKPFLPRGPCAWARNGRCRMESMSYDVLYGTLNTSGSPARNLLSPLFVGLDGRQHGWGCGP